MPRRHRQGPCTRNAVRWGSPRKSRALAAARSWQGDDLEMIGGAIDERQRPGWPRTAACAPTPTWRHRRLPRHAPPPTSVRLEPPAPFLLISGVTHRGGGTSARPDMAHDSDQMGQILGCRGRPTTAAGAKPVRAARRSVLARTHAKHRLVAQLLALWPGGSKDRQWSAPHAPPQAAAPSRGWLPRCCPGQPCLLARQHPPAPAPRPCSCHPAAQHPP